LGVAFFINEGGLFLTAAHVVKNHAGSDTPVKILYPDLTAKVIFTLRVSKLAIHPDLDVAIGLARVPLEVDLKRVVLGDGEIPVGESVRVFGYAHSSFVDQEGQSRLLGGSGLLGLTANIVCAFHLGEISDRFPQGVSELKGQSSFGHTAETLGGQSGGPVFSAVDDLVYGITSRGSVLYGLAVDIRAVLD
jgi:trypsin-like peptidase